MFAKLFSFATCTVMISMLFAQPAEAQFWKRNKDKKDEKQQEKKKGDTRCEDISLQWMPDDDEFADLDPVPLTGITRLAVEVATFEDNRRMDDPREIGRNIEDADDDDEEDRKILYVTTDDDIAAFVSEHVGISLREMGYDIVGAGEGEVILSGEVRSFHVEEDNTYQADVRLLVRATTRSGTVIYEAMHGESESNWGSSYKCDNYFEALAEALIETVHDMAETDDFYESLKLAAR